MTLRTAIRHGFSHLLRFEDRDARSAFWPFALAIVVLGQIVGFVLVLPIILPPFLQKFAAEQPKPVSTTSGFGQYLMQFRGTPTDLMPDFSAYLLIVLGVPVGTVLFLSAAVVRRLHDTGRCGWWESCRCHFCSARLQCSRWCSLISTPARSQILNQVRCGFRHYSPTNFSISRFWGC